jgi:hypothetical protein
LKRFLLALAVVACLTSVFVSTAAANHSWGGYHWARTSNPFTLKLGDNVASNWDSYLAAASSDWSRSTVLDTTIVPGQAANKRCKPTSGRVEVCAERYGNSGWLGQAQIWITTGNHISQGTARMNDYYFDSPSYNTPAWRSLVMCQEVAHTFGLDHQDENFDNPNLGTCMDYTSDPDGPPSNEHPNQHDYDQLVTIYSHLDSFTTVSAAPVTQAQSENASPVAVERSDRIASSTIVERFADGSQRITRIDWALR